MNWKKDSNVGWLCWESKKGEVTSVTVRFPGTAVTSHLRWDSFCCFDEFIVLVVSNLPLLNSNDWPLRIPPNVVKLHIFPDRFSTGFIIVSVQTLISCESLSEG
jgi:hypothetical protein